MFNFLLSILIGLNIISPSPVSLGVAINSAPPLFETSLAAAIGTSDTSLTLVSAANKDGTTLSGNVCLTIDSGLTTVEYVCGTASSTSVTGLTRGIGADGFTSYAALEHPHRYGADVKVTDFPYIQQVSTFLNGGKGLPNPLLYDSSTVSTSSFTNNNQLVSKGYADNLAFAGAPNGSLTQKGIYQEATGAQIASGTTSGSTGADLVLTTNVTATSSKANSVVTTNASGTLDASFVATQNYSLGTTTVQSLTSASSTLNGTTTILRAILTATSTPLATDATGKIIGVGGIAPIFSLYPIAGTSVVQDASNSSSTTSSSYVLLKDILVNATGTYTIYASLTASGSCLTATAQFYKNSSGLGGAWTAAPCATATVASTTAVSLNTGDHIQLYALADSGVTATITDFKLTAQAGFAASYNGGITNLTSLSSASTIPALTSWGTIVTN